MATIKDVAREAGLTVTTVSRVLNNRGYISDNARRKVAEAMEKLNYQPNEVARSLHKKSSKTIGVIVPHIRHPYFAEMISNLENAAYKEGYRILLCNTQSKEEKAKAYIEICTGNRVAGIILFSGQVAVETFMGLDIPVITMERLLDSGTAAVECDNRTGGALAAEKLIAGGCKNVILIGSTDTKVELPADQRSIGFREVCDRRGVFYVELDPEETAYNELTYGNMMEKALREYPKTDGVFASSDVIAAQTLQVCNRLGISVPGQMKIVGFDVMLAQLTTPQLTTIHQPIKEMAQTAVRLLVDAASGRMVPKQTVLPVQLIERGTA